MYGYARSFTLYPVRRRLLPFLLKCINLLRYYGHFVLNRQQNQEYRL